MKNRAEQLGLSLTDEEIKEATAHIKALADIKPLAMEDVDAILRHWRSIPKETLEEQLRTGLIDLARSEAS